MTRRIPAVLLAMGLWTAAASAQTRDWPNGEAGGSAPLGTPSEDQAGASTTPSSEGAPGGGQTSPQLTAPPVLDDQAGLGAPFGLAGRDSPSGPGLPPGRVWGGAEFLWWFTAAAHLPPLATSSPAGGNGIPGTTATTTVIGGDTRYGGGFNPGGRFYLGGWFDEGRQFGAFASVFCLAGNHASFNTSSNGSTVLGRPFLNAQTQEESAFILADANSTGSLSASATVGGLVGADVLLMEHLCCLSCSWMRVDALGGFRFLNLADQVNVSDNSMITGAGNTQGLPVGTVMQGQDNFKSHTSFYGLDFGLMGESLGDRFVFNWVAKLAVGTNHQVVDITGTTNVNEPGAAPMNFGQGFLAGPTNSGHYGRQIVSIAPEFDLRVGYRLTPSALVWVGYTFILWTGVARAPDQIDQMVNPSLLPLTGATTTGLQNTYSFQGNDFWIQGVAAGLFYRF
jgi:hypothetical protein